MIIVCDVMTASMLLSAKNRVLDSLSGKHPSDTPVAVFTQSATYGQMRACGSSWPEAHMDPVKMSMLGCAQADIFGLCSVRAPFCMTVEAEGLGCSVDLNGHMGMPTIKKNLQMGNPFDSPLPDIPDVDEQTYIGTGRAAVTIEAISLMRKRRGDKYPVVAGVVAPFTLAGQAIGAETIILGSVLDPEAVRKWSSAMDRIQRSYVDALVDAGADIVLFIDGVASPDMLDPANYWDLAGSRNSCIRRCKAVSILHMCGKSVPIIDDMISTGAHAISLDESTDPFELAEIVADRIPLIGNIGPVDTLLRGTPETIVENARRCRDAGFAVVTPGCGVCPATSDENMYAFSHSLDG